MSEGRRSEIEQRLKAITPWPWAWESIAEKSNEFAVGQAFFEDGTPISGRVPEGEWVEDVVIRRHCVGMNETGHANFGDAAFIAACPDDLRWLLDRLSEAEQALKETERFLADPEARRGNIADIVRQALVALSGETK